MAGRAASIYGSGMRKLVPFFVLIGALTACAVSDRSDAGGEGATAVERSAAPIVGGTADTGDPSVVMVLAQGSAATGSAICTGEVVSPHVVLTAAHCVSPQVAPAGATFAIFTGTDVNDTTQQSNAALWHEVKETHYDTAFNVNNLSGGHDVAVVILKQGLDVPLLPINRTALTAAQRGQSVRMIGYGITSGTDTTGKSAGTKRQTTTTLSAYDAKFLQFYDGTHETCEGDSGGPALMKVGGVETIMGVVSFGPQGCTMGATDTNVASYLSFIDTYVAPDLATYTNVAGGGACDANGECKTGFCADGVCCNVACAGQCEACAEPGSVGTCSIVPAKGKPRTGHPACTGVGPCAGTCDGTNRTGCVLPGRETICGVGCNTAGLSACNGSGGCSKLPCPGNFACFSTQACKTTCKVDGDCLAGFTCKTGNCVSATGPSCSADGASSLSPDGSSVSCAPYGCDDASGACRVTCATNADCVGGAACDASGSCAGGDPPSTTTKSGGCALGHGDAAPTGGARAGAGIAVCVAALALLKRRRR